MNLSVEQTKNNRNSIVTIEIPDKIGQVTISRYFEMVFDDECREHNPDFVLDEDVEINFVSVSKEKQGEHPGIDMIRKDIEIMKEALDVTCRDENFQNKITEKMIYAQKVLGYFEKGE